MVVLSVRLSPLAISHPRLEGGQYKWLTPETYLSSDSNSGKDMASHGGLSAMTR